MTAVRLAALAAGVALCSAAEGHAQPGESADRCRDHLQRVHVHAGVVTVCGRVQQVAFTDVRHGWVLAVADCATDLGVRVYRTSDGGASWRAFPTLLTVNCSGSYAYMRTRGADDLSLVATSANACDTSAVRTLDAGRRWYRFTLPGRCGGDLAFTGLVHGWYAGALWSPTTPLYETRDGGRTWRVHPLPRPNGYDALGPCLTASPRFDGDRALLPAFVRSRSRYTRAVYRTADAGRRWKVTLVGSAHAYRRKQGRVPWEDAMSSNEVCPTAHPEASP
jgi:photosystem II stability/assembly factor-like uncharacterized protein